MVSTFSSMCLERAPAVRPLAGKARINNACVLVGFRSVGVTSQDFGTLLGGNLKILRNIILQDGAEFTKVWAKSSKSVISYESGRIYFENYRCSYTSLTPQPQLLYEMPKRSKAEKIEDALLCQCPLDKVLAWPLEQKPSLLALTANNWLYHLSADTGQTLRKVYLSSHFKFRHKSEAAAEKLFEKNHKQEVMTLSLSKPDLKKEVHDVWLEQMFGGRAGIENNVLMHLAIFKVFPFDVIGLLEINRKVFGKTVVDVLLSQGVLAVSHSSKCVKLYSFEYIVKKFRTKKLILGQECDLYGTRGIVGDAPYGIPLNIHIKECPPVLFEMSYLDNGIQIGGHPWHYVYTPNHKRHRGTHHICSISDGALAKNGVQDMKCDSLEADWIFFHPDDSGRIIHAGPSTINVLKIRAEKEFSSQYEVVCDFSIMASRENSVSSQVTVTSSGRTVKKRFQQLEDDPEQETFKMVKYEDELDLLAIVDVSHTEDEGQASVRLHHNKSGALLKKIALQDPWDVTYSHEVYFDRDTIIHIEQERNNSYCCHVYKIKRRTN